MERLDPILLVDAIAVFAAHERHARPRTLAPARFADARYALLKRATVLGRLQKALPIETLRVRLDPADVARLTYADGRSPSEWVEWVKAKRPQAYEHYDTLAHSPTPVAGPLLLAGQNDASLVVYDGYHRVAAWWAHIERGQRYPIDANLVVTQLAPR